MKQFVRSLDADGQCFQYIVSTFPALFLEKIKAGVFDGPQIRALVRNGEFVSKMNDLEKAA